MIGGRTRKDALPRRGGLSENERWIEAWMDRWGGVLGKLAILFGAGSLVVGWLQGGVL